MSTRWASMAPAIAEFVTLLALAPAISPVQLSARWFRQIDAVDRIWQRIGPEPLCLDSQAPQDTAGEAPARHGSGLISTSHKNIHLPLPALGVDEPDFRNLRGVIGDAFLAQVIGTGAV